MVLRSEPPTFLPQGGRSAPPFSREFGIFESGAMESVQVDSATFRTLLGKR